MLADANCVMPGRPVPPATPVGSPKLKVIAWACVALMGLNVPATLPTVASLPERSKVRFPDWISVAVPAVPPVKPPPSVSA